MKKERYTKDQFKKLQEIIENLEKLHFNKYTDKSFEIHKKLCAAKKITDVFKNLTPLEKLILFYENQLENILLYRNLFPVPESDIVIKKLIDQVQGFYKNILEPIFIQKYSLEKKEIEKIEKLKEFMKDIDIDLKE